MTLDKELDWRQGLRVTATSASSQSTVNAKKRTSLRNVIDDTKEFVTITKLSGGLVPQSMVSTLLGLSRQRVHQLVSEGVFSHWNFYGMKWLSQNEVVEFSKVQRRAGENQHAPTSKEIWKASRETGKEWAKARKTHGS